eukprot:scaffold206_cov400-Prasinococcus_capsulatus_cf.AAC.7
MPLWGRFWYKVSCGGAHSAFVTSEGALLTVGLNDFGQLGRTTDPQEALRVARVDDLAGEKIVSVAAGHYHTLCVTSEGQVWSFGCNGKGQLGQDDRFGKRETRTPMPVRGMGDARVVKVAASLSSVAAGADHSLALTEDGAVYSWGSSADGRLGHGEQRSFFKALFASDVQPIPRRIRPLQGVRVVDIAAGHLHSAVVDDQGLVYTFGSGRFWQLGHGTDRDSDKPQPVQELVQCTRVACGGLHTLALDRFGRVWAWGANQSGCLGVTNDGARPGTSVRFPGRVEHLTASCISAGWKHSAAIDSTGRLFTWGWGGSEGTFHGDGSTGGQLGHDDEGDYWEPHLTGFLLALMMLDVVT